MYKYIEELPSKVDWSILLKKSNWSSYSIDVIATMRVNSLFGVAVYHKNMIIGMGRVIGDGATIFSIHTVYVLPEFRAQGIGKNIVFRLINQIEKIAITGGEINIFASKNTEQFYQKLGFDIRPNSTKGSGMFLTLN